MKRFTKALSMLLAIVMVVGLLPLSIIAEDIQTTHTVQFKLNYNGAHKIPSQKVADGECAVQPEDVTRTGWIFEYWYVKTGDGIQKFDLSQPITEDVTLYARWDEDITYWGPIWSRNILNGIAESEKEDKPETDEPEDEPDAEGLFTVTFNANGENVSDMPEAQKVAGNGYAKYPGSPRKDGYQFAGWFLDKDESDWTNRFDFATYPITKNITLNAVWVDITTDTDGDQLADELEEYIGTDVNSQDTDNDGLTDYQEVVIVGTDPLMKDSDQNNVDDFYDDEDVDTLSNGEEIVLGTDPRQDDTDYDGLTDPDEINIYHTSPTDADSDGDGASDSWELTNGFDPLVYNDSFMISGNATAPISDNNPVTASVELRVKGSQVDSLSVIPVAYADNKHITTSIPGYLGVAYDFSIDGEFESAKLIFEYDIALGDIGSDFIPRIYYFNETTKSFEELPNQIVEPGKVSATVTHFSTYILLNKVEFDAVWSTEIKPPNYTSEYNGIDIVFVIDSSGSMYSNDRYNLRLTAAKNFVDKLGENDRAAVIDFDSYASVYQTFTADHTLLYNAIGRVDDSGGTNLSKGISLAISQFTSSEYTRTDAYKYIIFLTDGDGSYSTSYTTQAKENNIVIYTIGLGSGVRESVLKGIADGTGGKYYFASAASDLNGIYTEVSVETIDYVTDSNNDGISDYYSKLIYEGNLVLSNGSDEFTGIDFNLDADYDGDGLKNGQELIITHNTSTGRIYMNMYSDPLMVHSDMDGLSDYTEYLNGTDPLVTQERYSKYYTDYLYDDSNYYYEYYVDNVYDDSWFYQADSAFLATIFGVWNLEELARDIVTDYMYSYVDSFDQTIDKYERNTLLDNLDSLLSKASGLHNDVGNLAFLKDVIPNIKNLISVINGYVTSLDAIYVEYYKIVQMVAVYDPSLNTIIMSTRSMSSTSVTVITSKSPLKAGSLSKFSVAMDLIEGGIDIADTVATFAKINAHSQVFEENIDFLTDLRDNGTRKMVRDATNDIINAMGEGYGKALASAIGGDIAEMSVKLAITIASKNPYVAAVVFARDVIDKITGMKDTLKREYEMLVYNTMASSIKGFIYDALYGYGDYYYDQSGDFLRYGTHLAQIRILGEKKYQDFYIHGANSWFNDTDKIKENVKISINNVKTCADALELELSAALD